MLAKRRDLVIVEMRLIERTIFDECGKSLVREGRIRVKPEALGRQAEQVL